MNRTLLKKLVLPLVFVATGLSLLFYPTTTDLAYEASQSLGFTKAETAESAAPTQPLPEDAVARLSIPEIELETTVFAGTTQKALKKGPGHYEETPLPGQPGNSAIAGHRTMYGHPFRHLDQLEDGDEILVRTQEGSFTYRVNEKKVVSPTDLSVIDSTEETRLTLTTCNPVGSARERLVIMAVLDEV